MCAQTTVTNPRGSVRVSDPSNRPEAGRDGHLRAPGEPSPAGNVAPCWGIPERLTSVRPIVRSRVRGSAISVRNSARYVRKRQLNQSNPEDPILALASAQPRARGLGAAAWIATGPVLESVTGASRALLGATKAAVLRKGAVEEEAVTVATHLVPIR